ncbi:MAG TPA: PhnD/SsuA/transferrin family substrate-binding protein, partial [Ktedonobacterales bacterium]|nr:PhnD/SsuA/transferrin family substrate-binding protein [Ktedonobacterales bacterium]
EATMSEQTPLRFATYLAPNMRPVYAAIAAYVGRWVGQPATLTARRDFAAFARGAVDAGFICGLPYVQLTRAAEPAIEPLAAPVLQGARYGDRPIYFSDVIVRHDSPARRFADLRGCTWAYNDVDSHSGYNITRYTLLCRGETRGFFGRVVAAGYHQRGIRLVASGAVDAAAIDTQVLAIELREHPELREQLRVIETLGPATIQPVVAARHLPAALKDAMRAALVAMGNDPGQRAALDAGYIARFAPIRDADYDDIRAMVAAAEAADFLVLR